MIIYKCDICGKEIEIGEMITLHAASVSLSKCFEVCPGCFEFLTKVPKPQPPKAPEPITEKKTTPKTKRERLTDPCWRNFDPWECCGLGRDCKRDAHEKNGCCNGCIVPKLYARLAEYEDREEKGATDN